VSDVAQIAAGLTLPQRVIMLGDLYDIPPEDCDELESLGLKGAAYFHPDEHSEDRRMVWPITPLGLAVRAYLQDAAPLMCGGRGLPRGFP
jgi:hypothetical protein